MLPEPAPAPSRLVRNTDFLAFWAGESLSLAAAEITALALLFTAVTELDADPLAVGVLNAARFAPYLLFALLIGWWFDRHRRRPALVLSSLGRAVLAGVVPVAALGGLLSIQVLWVVGFGIGLLTLIFDIGSLSLVPGLVERGHLTEANSKIQASYSLAGIAGPGAAGFLVGLLTAPFTLVASSISYLLSAGMIAGVRRREPEPDVPDRELSMPASIASGLRAVVGNRVLRDLATQSGVFNLFENAVTTIFALHAVRGLGLTPAQLGFVLGTGAVGSFVGAVLAVRVTNALGRGRTLRAATLVACLSPPLLLIPQDAAVPSIALLAATLAVHGMALVVFNINTLTLRQSVTPSHLLGRMNASYRLVLFSTVPLGALLAGSLGNLFPLRTVLLLGVLGLLSPVLWIFFSAALRPRHARRRRDPVSPNRAERSTDRAPASLLVPAAGPSPEGT
jgi:MFS family permease